MLALVIKTLVLSANKIGRALCSMALGKSLMYTRNNNASMTVDINRLTKNDLIIFWGFSNDVSKNNSQDVLKHLVNFVQSNNHTNIF
jgi:hypothetical protein